MIGCLLALLLILSLTRVQSPSNLMLAPYFFLAVHLPTLISSIQCKPDTSEDEEDQVLRLLSPLDGTVESHQLRRDRHGPGRRSTRERMPTHCVYNGGRCGNILSHCELQDGLVRCLPCRIRCRAVSQRYRDSQKSGDFSKRSPNRKRRRYDHLPVTPPTSAVQVPVRI